MFFCETKLSVHLGIERRGVNAVFKGMRKNPLCGALEKEKWCQNQRNIGRGKSSLRTGTTVNEKLQEAGGCCCSISSSSVVSVSFW